MTQAPDEHPNNPIFKSGYIVRHKRYGYRGVIVDFDPKCLANDDWYRSNQSQPDRDQPWYHVLVDATSATTYAAQENLDPDTANLPITHPLIDQFFSGFFDGRHLRNTTPWPH